MGDAAIHRDASAVQVIAHARLGCGLATAERNRDLTERRPARHGMNPTRRENVGVRHDPFS